MRKSVLPILFFLASLLAIYAQSLAYFLNDHVLDVEPLYILTILTALSVVLFIVYLYVSLFTYIKGKSASGKPLLVILLGVIGATLLSLWSLFVLAMWWG